MLQWLKPILTSRTQTQTSSRGSNPLSKEQRPWHWQGVRTWMLKETRIKLSQECRTRGFESFNICSLILHRLLTQRSRQPTRITSLDSQQTIDVIELRSALVQRR